MRINSGNFSGTRGLNYLFFVPNLSKLYFCPTLGFSASFKFPDKLKTIPRAKKSNDLYVIILLILIIAPVDDKFNGFDNNFVFIFEEIPAKHFGSSLLFHLLGSQ